MFFLIKGDPQLYKYLNWIRVANYSGGKSSATNFVMNTLDAVNFSVWNMYELTFLSHIEKPFGKTPKH